MQKDWKSNNMNKLLIGNDFHAIYYTRKELIKELVKLHNVYVAIPKKENNKYSLAYKVGLNSVVF